jgi:hypothetical protein
MKDSRNEFRLICKKQIGGQSAMKPKRIKQITAGIALSAALPLGLLGIKPLFFSAKPAMEKPPVEEIAKTAGASEHEEKVEIFLSSGDSQTIASALKRLPAEGGRLVLGPGVFEIYEPIVLDRDNVELTGSGKLTVLRVAERSACPAVVVGTISTPSTRTVNRVTVRNLVIDGNHRATDPECWGGVCDSGGLTFIRNNALTIRSAEEIKIEHIVARNARSGGVVLEKCCRQIYIDDLEACDNYFDGLACYETEDSYFTRLKLHHNRSAGVSLDLRFNHNVIKTASLHHNGSQGIFMRESNSNDFRKLEIHDNGAQGIFIAQADAFSETRCTNNTFSDLTVMNNKGHGMRVNDASCIENLVRNSAFENNAQGNVSEATQSLLALHKVTGL